MDTVFSKSSFTSRPVLSTGLVCISAALILRPLISKFFSTRPRCISSPRETILPHLSLSEVSSLPYPPDVLPGGRDLPTPYGTIKVFEFGPLSGERVLLLAGLSTPIVAMSNLAEALTESGYRVMLFDYFGRGWSDTPNPEDVDHDERLYASQILCALAGSELSWTGNAGRDGTGGFHLIGYSFGGGLAVSFASWFGHMVRSLTVVAPGGLVKRSSNSWRTSILYSRGWLPEGLLRYLARRRFEPAKSPPKRVITGAHLVQQAEPGRDKGKTASGDPFNGSVISDRRPNVTVASVMEWQLRHHKGFIPAVMSAFRYGPIHERYEEWRRVGALLSARRSDPGLPGLLGGKIFLVLGATDLIVREAQMVPEMKSVLGEDSLEVAVLDAGHEVAITKGAEVAGVAILFWTRMLAG